MAQTDYPVAAMKRLARAIDALDDRSRDVLAYHLAIERELDVALAALLPRADRLWGLGFGQKVSVLQATSNLGWIDLVARALIEFNNLRNAVAHGRSKGEIDKAFSKTCSAAASISGSEPPPKATVGGLALVICGALAVDIDERSDNSITHH
jgi:hypothetical protein